MYWGVFVAVLIGAINQSSVHLNFLPPSMRQLLILSGFAYKAIRPLIFFYKLYLLLWQVCDQYLPVQVKNILHSIRLFVIFFLLTSLLIMLFMLSLFLYLYYSLLSCLLLLCSAQVSLWIPCIFSLRISIWWLNEPEEKNHLVFSHLEYWFVDSMTQKKNDLMQNCVILFLRLK